MNGKVIAAVAVVFVAAGVLMLATVSAITLRNLRESSKNDQPPTSKAIYVGKDDWKNVKIIKEFSLTERSGREFDSKELDGKVWVVSFFFSSCPSTCKDQNGHVARLQKEYGPKGVTFVSISCDPETDTPERLREYAHSFNADPKHWLFLTDDDGELLHVQRIGAEVFAVHVDKGVHMNRFTVVDKWGKVRGHFEWTDPAQLAQLEKALDELLAEASPPEDEDATEESPAAAVESADSVETAVSP